MPHCRIEPKMEENIQTENYGLNKLTRCYLYFGIILGFLPIKLTKTEPYLKFKMISFTTLFAVVRLFMVTVPFTLVSFILAYTTVKYEKEVSNLLK